MGHARQHDLLEVREDLLHLLGQFGRCLGEGVEDFTRLHLGADRPLPQGLVIVCGPVGHPPAPAGKVSPVHRILPTIVCFTYGATIGCAARLGA